jgi:hypothetical protein
MKKILWILSLIITFSGAFSQKQPVDSLVIYHFNSETDSLYESKTIYTYDSKSRKTDELLLSWDIESLSWKNDRKIHYAYDNADSLTLEARYTYETGKWTGYFRKEKTYDVNGKLVLFIYSHDWDSTLNEFVPLIKEEKAYNGNKVSEFTSYNWMKDLNGGEWVPQIHELSTFSERGDCVLHISSWWLQAENIWQNSLKDSTVYDDQGRQTLFYQFFWDWTAENWIVTGPQMITEYIGLLTTSTNYSDEGQPLFKIEYVYDENGNILSDTSYVTFPSNEWTYEMREIYTYDDNQNMTSVSRAMWDETLNAWYMEAMWEKTFDDHNREVLHIAYERYTDTADWNETVRFERTYDNSGNLVEKTDILTLGTNASKVLYHFDNLGELKSFVQYDGIFKPVWPYPGVYALKSWVLASKGYYYWNEKIPSGTPATEAGSLRIFPNPAADVICISGIHGTANLAVYDLQGNLVLLRNAESDQPISLSGLSKGIYLAKVKTADGIFERKIVKSE